MSRKAFTLVELLVYLGIFAATSVAFVNILLITTQVTVREASVAEVSQESAFLLQQIQYYVAKSSLVDMPQDIPTSTLKLWMGITTQDPTYLTLASGTVYLTQATGTPQALTSNKVTITNLTFTRHSNAPSHDTVSVSFTLSYNTSNIEQAFSQMLQTSIIRVSAATFDSNIIPSSTATYNIGVYGATWSSINQTIYFSGSNVGIGAINPLAKLDVTDTDALGNTVLNVSGVAARNIGLVTLNLTGAWGGNANEDHGLIISGPTSPYNTSLFYIKTAANVPILRVNDAGNVGIGTTNPQTYTNYVGLTIGDNNAAKTGFLKFRSTYNSGDGAEIYQDQSGFIGININGSSRAMTISSGGNVGIGTMNPGYKLDVNGTANAAQYCISGTNCISTWPTGGGSSSSSQWTTGSGGIIYYNGGNVGIGTANPSQALTVAGQILMIGYPTGLTLGNGQSIYDNGVGGLNISTYGGNIALNGGNVGIGNAAPSVKLDVLGVGPNLGGTAYWNMQTHQDMTSDRGLLFGYDTSMYGGMIAADAVGGNQNNLTFWGYNGSAWGEKMRIQGNGNVGIGTASPGNKLDVNGGINAQAFNIDSGNFIIGPVGGAYRIWTRNTTPLAFFVNNGEVMRITDGNVGIGNASPGQKLSIDGTLPVLEMRSGGFLMFRPVPNNYDFNIWSDGTGVGSAATLKIGSASQANTFMTILESGNVGIGTTGPGAKLDVAGNIHFTGTISGGNLAVGSEYWSNYNGNGEWASGDWICPVGYYVRGIHVSVACSGGICGATPLCSHL